MPRVGRKASSLILFALLSATAFLSALGSVAAQGAEYEGIQRTLTIGPINEACDAGGCLWDTPRLVFRPGDQITLQAVLHGAIPHNLKIGEPNEDAPFEVTYEPASSDGTTTQVGAQGLTVFANFTVPADFAEESFTYVCTLHAETMVGEFLTPEAFAAAGGEPEAIHHMGVHFLAYWVGLIAFAILFVVYGITFFLFKYNETTATTDQWDRTGAGAPETKNTMSSGNATLIAIVIGLVALAAVIWLARMG